MITINAFIQLIDGEVVKLEKLQSIEYFSGLEQKHIENFKDFLIKPELSYTFIAENESVSVSPGQIKYVHFSK